METWRDIPGYEGYYQVSDMGNVKSLPRFVAHSQGGVCQLKGQKLSPAISTYGYKIVSLCKERKQKTFHVSVLVAMAFLNHKPNGKHDIIVDHKNNVKTEDRLNNLQLITNRKNTSKDVRNKTSRFTGVCWHKRMGRWVASIQINGKAKWLGSFDDEEAAAAAYQGKLIKI